MGRRLVIAIAALAAATLPALAAGGFECRCLYQGKFFSQGETVCIRVDGRAKLARCDMMLNNSSWTFLKSGCPSAMMTPVPPGLGNLSAASVD